MPAGERSPWVRVPVALTLWLASAFAAVIVADVLPLSEPYAEATASFVLMCIYALLAPLVSYRWFDTFLLLVPLIQLWWSAKVMWRISSLPNRYWPARPGEVSRPSLSGR